MCVSVSKAIEHHSPDGFLAERKAHFSRGPASKDFVRVFTDATNYVRVTASCSQFSPSNALLYVLPHFIWSGF